MHDGRTRRVETRDLATPERWLAENRASLVVLNGPAAGSEFELLSPRILVGRSASADLRLDDQSVSTEHAAVGRTGRPRRLPAALRERLAGTEER